MSGINATIKPADHHAGGQDAHAPSTHHDTHESVVTEADHEISDRGFYADELSDAVFHSITGGKHLSFMNGSEIHFSLAALDRAVLHATPHQHSTKGSVPFDAYFFVAVKDNHAQLAYEVIKAVSSRFNGKAPAIHKQAVGLASVGKIVHYVVLTKRTLTSEFQHSYCGDRKIALLVGGTLREDTAYIQKLLETAADRVVTMLSSVDKAELEISKEQVLEDIHTPFDFSAFKDDH
ncbi:hypothetical protein IT409_03110 [Candidatus Falkowbacteria bacterium]|nr:hypothetical protein [Candidatus Falkowbacteria bacterium]